MDDMTCTVCGDEFTPDDEHAESTMCTPCGKMVGGAMRKREESRGSGSIQGQGGRPVDGKLKGPWVQYDKTDEMRLLMEWSDPEIEYNYEDEQRFNDFDLMSLSYWRMRKALDKRGFTDIPHEDVEEYAQDVCADMVQKIASGEDIESIHGYHWGLVNGRMKQLMVDYVERRKATIPEDVLDYAEANNIRDPYNYGAWDSLEDHRVREPLWTKLSVEDIEVQFGEAGIRLSNREITCLRNALTGENKGLQGSAYTKRLLNKVARKVREAEGGEEAWANIKELING